MPRKGKTSPISFEIVVTGTSADSRRDEFAKSSADIRLTARGDVAREASSPSELARLDH